MPHSMLSGCDILVLDLNGQKHNGAQYDPVVGFVPWVVGQSGLSASGLGLYVLCPVYLHQSVPTLLPAVGTYSG